jgi:hypothetical protein
LNHTGLRLPYLQQRAVSVCFDRLASYPNSHDNGVMNVTIRSEPQLENLITTIQQRLTRFGPQVRPGSGGPDA